MKFLFVSNQGNQPSNRRSYTVTEVSNDFDLTDIAVKESDECLFLNEQIIRDEFPNLLKRGKIPKWFEGTGVYHFGYNPPGLLCELGAEVYEYDLIWNYLYELDDILEMDDNDLIKRYFLKYYPEYDNNNSDNDDDNDNDND